VLRIDARVGGALLLTQVPDEPPIDPRPGFTDVNEGPAAHWHPPTPVVHFRFT
jgi:hypothetical protein